ncbi:2-dehydro-3-deoxygalactonokinase [Paenirhodobacter sp. CAU 1674]|uniref:2-dehydro-3-deoxygalactonokinase n=1 Tax=Paenirhodobacter sp. CAU 1674 TaxID=3032596 RepID=UPI0023DC2791|nr:2-dehydro-3-deoxygalactonokinase [Paenirhodobacter sp. CAU 1674]MDF2142260.1 2-dehydro-3-deoxygalactonokinase [Paenirhodobacter sp. CAU 1674]
MAAIAWIALSEDPGLFQTRAFDMSGTQIERRTAPKGDAALCADWQAPVVAARLHPDVAPRPLPCAPLPDAGSPDLPALQQATPPEIVHPAEVARIAGLLAAQPQFDGVVWLCGATSLWAHLSAGEVVSVTRTASAALLPPAARCDGPGFADALADCLSRPERLLRHLAPVAEDRALPEATTGAAAGAVLGADLAAAKPWWLGQQVLALDCATAPGWAALGAQALSAQGVQVTQGDGEAALVAGLAAFGGRT